MISEKHSNIFHSSKPSANSILIFSKRPNIKSIIKEQIHLAGDYLILEPFKSFKEDNVFTDDVYGVVIDIENVEDIHILINELCSHVPRRCWCVLIGSNDSIHIAQQLADKGFLYLHDTFQIRHLTQYLLKRFSNGFQRQAFVISVLSCKGGIGSSWISYCLAKFLSNYKKATILLQQGKNSSQDLDIIATEAMRPGMIKKHDRFLDLLYGKGASFSDQDDQSKRYHFKIMEDPIYNIEREKQEYFLMNSQCILLVMDRSLTSVRVAKNFIESFSRFSHHEKDYKRFLICVNESRPWSMDQSLSLSEISKVLEHPISIRIPYLGKYQALLNSRSPTYFNKISKLVLGLPCEQKLALSSFWKKIIYVSN